MLCTKLYKNMVNCLQPYICIYIHVYIQEHVITLITHHIDHIDLIDHTDR